MIKLSNSFSFSLCYLIGNESNINTHYKPLSAESIPQFVMLPITGNLAVFPAAICRNREMILQHSWQLHRHIQAYARLCRVLELNQQANHSRHDAGFLPQVDD
jgi:hypothetical protein